VQAKSPRKKAAGGVAKYDICVPGVGLQCVAVCCSVLQCALQCVVVHTCPQEGGGCNKV